MSVRLGALALLLTSCTCSEEPPTKSSELALTTAATWSLAPLPRAESLTLPAPCRPLGPTLQANVPVDDELLPSSAHAGELLVVSNPADRCLVTALTMSSGLAPAEPWQSAPKLVSPIAFGETVMVVGGVPDGRRIKLLRGPRVPSEELAHGDGLAVLAAGSSPTGAAVVVRNGEGRITVFTGAPNLPSERWEQVHLDLSDAGRRVAKVHEVGADGALLALDHGNEVEWLRVRPGSAQPFATLPLGGDVLDVVLEGRRPAMLAPVLGAADGEGGARLERLGAAPVTLRGSMRARRGWLAPLDGGLFAVWTTGASDAGPGSVHAAFVTDEGVVGPIAMVGRATAVVLSARGERVDLWLRERGIVRYAAAECSTKKGARTSPSE